MSKLKKVICLVLMVAFFTVMFAKDSHAVEFDVKAFLDNIHVRVGVAYKTHETDVWFEYKPMKKSLTARLGVWYRFENVISESCYIDAGVDHHSGYSEGAPFNSRDEYMKQEWFIDGTCRLSVFF